MRGSCLGGALRRISCKTVRKNNGENVVDHSRKADRAGSCSSPAMNPAVPLLEFVNDIIVIVLAINLLILILSPLPAHSQSMPQQHGSSPQTMKWVLSLDTHGDGHPAYRKTGPGFPCVLTAGDMSIEGSPPQQHESSRNNELKYRAKTAGPFRLGYAADSGAGPPPGDDVSEAASNEESFRWEAYRWQFIGIAAIIFIQTLFILILVVNLRKRRAANLALRHAELKYRTVADFTSDWEYWSAPDGVLHYISPSCERITGYSGRRFVDDPALLREIIHPEDREVWDGHERDEHGKAESRGVRFRIQTRDGAVRWIDHACQPVIGEQGEFQGIRSSNRDITEEKRAEEALAAQLRFETLIAQISARFVNLAPDQVDAEIQEALRRICECLGFDRSTVWQVTGGADGPMVMTHIHQPEDGPPVRKPAVESRLSSGERADRMSESRLNLMHMEAQEHFPWLTEQARQGRIVLIPRLEDLPAEASFDKEMLGRWGARSTSVIPFMAGGVAVGAMTFAMMRQERELREELVNRLKLCAQVFANAIARKRAEQKLRESEERLSLAAASANVGLWSLDRCTGRMWATEKTRELLGFAPGEELSFERVLSAVHVEDREKVRRTFDLAMQPGEDARLDYRVVNGEGGVRWIAWRGRSRHNSPGRPNGLMGVSVDITDRKSAELSLQQSEEKFSRAFHGSPVAMSLVSLSDVQYIEINKAHERFTGYARDEVLGRTVGDMRLWLDPQELEAAVEKIRSDGSLRALEARFRTKGGERRMGCLSADLVEFSGQRCILAVIEDVTERKLMQEQLQNRLLEIERLKGQLEQDNIALREEVSLLSPHDDIVARSPAMRQVLLRVEQVAPTDSTVLITGETGTGKELIARAVHNLSARKGRPLVTVNCASLPPTLMESELFGREKGAYTGALSRMAGRFEVADGGTLFLDEVGELPPELQAKMLRVLEEGRFERLGSTKSLHVNVRILAATNRDLAQLVQAGRFRRDLYYRLNVFPIAIPPLRERPEDIPPLVWAFIHQFEKRMGKHVQRVLKRSMDALERHAWPGNVRELRNVIEHAMIVSSGSTLKVFPPMIRAEDSSAEVLNLEESERRHILRVLTLAGWRVAGKGGAAEILGLKPTTLEARMKKLGVRRPRS
ncbi:sigma54 specific transcriptional regulator, Fis family [Syntrophobacter fumaroxidans MPOB]|uniref:Sigma54 specific transcriptional regulator, Fis family n=1 Tax=Syntrophobacter fumaroxidans (strain DSM 10017 / MPOB) TaxID=335543 RepID=A0LIA2_SYNFM|nr:sigma54 specific transcriptional regulator, Fis family [Syntrophobacter fumaroxidans MPOB]